MKKKLLPLFLMFSLFISCQTEIDIDLPEYTTKMVVEGSIENDAYPMVMLTKSIPYFSTIDIETLINEVFITDAKVTVTSSDGESEELRMTLTEESPLYVAYVGKTLKGKENTHYTLKIEWDGKEYTATTSIPQTFELDSIWLNKYSTSDNDSVATVRMILNDNPAERNYYQFLSKTQNDKIKDRTWVYTLPAVFDDATFNGLTFNYEVMRASPSSLQPGFLTEEEWQRYYSPFYHKGDIILVKHLQMDYNSYKLWSLIANDLSFGSAAGVFMSIPPRETNISCNTGELVLGAWYGYASVVDTIYF